MTDADLCFDAWTIRKVPNDDFGQSHWDYNDEVDYQNNNNNYGDDGDDDYRNGDNRTIEQFDEDDFGMNFFNNAARGFDGDSRNRDGPFNYSDGGGYNQQWGGENRFNYNDGGRYNQQWDGSDQFTYNDGGDYGQQWNRDDQSEHHHKHGHHHHHHRH